MKAPLTARLYINCDDITEIWGRFPGLEPNGPVPDGLLVVQSTQAQELSDSYRALAGAVAGSTAAFLGPLAAAWDETASTLGPGSGPRGTEWTAVAEILAAGLGLGLAVPRRVGWREPAAFCLAGASRFLRFEFLPGGGKAGIGLISSSLCPKAGELVRASSGRDFAQTMNSYESPQGEMIAYGAAGSALRAAGLLVKSGVGLQPTAKLAIPVITRERLDAVAAAWQGFVDGVALEVTGKREQLDQGLTKAFGDSYPPRPGHITRAADYLDMAYAVLADMIYAAWRDTGALSSDGADTGQQRRTGRGLLSRGVRGPLVPGVLLESPTAIWDWLRRDCGQRTDRPSES